MKTIALIHPKIDFKENYPCSWIPFSVLSIGSALPSDRFKIKIFDEHCIEKEKIYDSLKNDDVLIIGLSIMTGGGQIKNAIETAEHLKAEHPEAFIVFGGPHANVLPEQTLSSSIADCVICGAGQTAMTMLADSLDRNVEPANIPGVYYKKNGRKVTVKHPPSTKIQESRV